MAASAGRCLPAAFRWLRIATTAMAPGTVFSGHPGKEQDPREDHGHNNDDSHQLDPPGGRGGRFAAGALSGVVPGVVGVWHVPVLPYGRGVHSFAKHCVAVNAWRHRRVATYNAPVPKLWDDTIEAHRGAVRDAILNTTATLVAERGLLSVTMSQIAEGAGIGRATLYKYFPDVEAILLAWHEGQIASHLDQLAGARDKADGPRAQLEAVLEGFALISHESQGHHDTELATFLHRDHRVARARHQLHAMVRDLLKEGAANGELRDDVAPDELAGYCIHALGAASGLPSKAAVRRLVAVTLAGLRP